MVFEFIAIVCDVSGLVVDQVPAISELGKSTNHIEHASTMLDGFDQDASKIFEVLNKLPARIVKWLVQ